MLPPTIASRCGWPLPPGAACSCRWASSTPLAVRSTPRWAGRTIFGVPATRRRADLTADVAAANALVDHVAEYRVDGEMRQLTDAQDAVTALLRSDAPDPRNASRAVMVLANPDIGRIVPVGLSVSPLPPQAGAALALEETREDADAPMDPGEVRVLAYAPTRPVIHPVVRDEELHPSRLAAARIAIEAILPQVPDGAFAVKRLVGESVTVSADIIADGHDVLAAELLWAADDEADWHRVAMQLGRRRTIAGKRASCRRESVGIGSPCRHGGMHGEPSATICPPNTPPARP